MSNDSCCHGKVISLLHGHTLGKSILPRKLERFLDNLYLKYNKNHFLNLIRNSKLNYLNYLESLASRIDSDYVCIGHSHSPNIKAFEDNIVCNSGDWTHDSHCSWPQEENGLIDLHYFHF